jgi:hypothetical protein
MLSLLFGLTIISSVAEDDTISGVLSADPVMPAEMKLVWTAHETGFEELFIHTSVQLPSELASQDLAPSLGSKIIEESEPGKLQLVMPGTQELLRNSSGDQVLALKVQSLSSPLISKNCTGLDVELVETERIPPSVYIGIYCSRGEDQSLKFWITAPADVRWGETSIFEQSGKGERWRGYSIQNFTPIESELIHATFGFYTEDASFGLKLVQKPNAELLAKEREAREKIIQLEEENRISELRRQEIEWRKQKLQKENVDLVTEATAARERERLVKASLSLGGVMIDIKTKTTKKKSYQGLFALEGATRPLLYTLGFGGGFKYAPPIGKMSLWDLSVQMQSTWNFGDATIRPGLGFHTFGIDYTAKSLAFRHSSLGLDLFFQYGKKYQFWALVSSSGLLPPGDSRYLSGSVGYRFPFWKFLNVGPRASYQYITYPDAQGKFQQMIAGFDVGF